MKSIQHRAVNWIVGRDTGMSSQAIWAHMMGADESEDGWCHPHDPSDLGRCLRLLELIPEWKERMGEMAERSPAWRALVEHWDELQRSMEKEVGIDWSKGSSAPKTYELMTGILNKAYEEQRKDNRIEYLETQVVENEAEIQRLKDNLKLAMDTLHEIKRGHRRVLGYTLEDARRQAVVTLQLIEKET